MLDYPFDVAEELILHENINYFILASPLMASASGGLFGFRNGSVWDTQYPLENNDSGSIFVQPGRMAYEVHLFLETGQPAERFAGNPALFLPVVLSFVIWTPVGFLLTAVSLVRGFRERIASTPDSCG